MGLTTMPWRNGWMVSWYTGETKTIRFKNGRTKEVRMKDSFEHYSKERVEARAKELREAGFEIEMLTECIF